MSAEAECGHFPPPKNTTSTHFTLLFTSTTYHNTRNNFLNGKMIQPIRNDDVEQQYQEVRSDMIRSFRQTNKCWSFVIFLAEQTFSMTIAISLMKLTNIFDSVMFIILLTLFNLIVEGINIFNTVETVAKKIMKTSYQQTKTDTREFATVFISHYLMQKTQFEQSYIGPSFRVLFVVTLFTLGVKRSADSIYSSLESSPFIEIISQSVMIDDLLYQSLRIQALMLVFIVISRIISSIVNPLGCICLIRLVGDSSSSSPCYSHYNNSCTSILTRTYAFQAIKTLSKFYPLINQFICPTRLFHDGIL